MPPTTSTTAAPPTTTITTENLAGAKAWFTSNVGILQDLQNDLNKVTDSGNTGNKSGVIAGCTQLASDTTAAQHLPPIPDTTIQGEWSDSLTDFADAAQDCVQGLQNNDVTEMSTYKVQLQSGIIEQTNIANAIKGS